MGGGGCAPSQSPPLLKAAQAVFKAYTYMPFVRASPSKPYICYVRKPLQQTSMRLSGLEALCVLRF